MSALGAVVALQVVLAGSVVAVIWIAGGVVAALVVLGLWLLAGTAVAVLHYSARRAGLNYQERHR